MDSDQNSKGNLREWMRYGNLGIEMLVSVLIGTFGGYWIDSFLQTKPWVMIVGFILGSAAGFRSLFRLLHQENRKKVK